MQKISTLDDKIIQIPECSICLQSLSKDLNIIIDCGHVFHKECIVDLKKSGYKECPICRAQMNNICDIFYTIKIKEVKDEPKYMANMIQIITLKEEIEKLKLDGQNDRDSIQNLEQIVSTKDQKIQKQKQKYKNSKIIFQLLKYQELKTKCAFYENLIEEVKKSLQRAMLDNEKQIEKLESFFQKLRQQNNENNKNKQISFQTFRQFFGDGIRQFSQQNLITELGQLLVQDNMNQTTLLSKSQKKQCIKQIQSFETAQRQQQ